MAELWLWGAGMQLGGALCGAGLQMSAEEPRDCLKWWSSEKIPIWDSAPIKSIRISECENGKWEFKTNKNSPDESTERVKNNFCNVEHHPFL